LPNGKKNVSLFEVYCSSNFQSPKLSDFVSLQKLFQESVLILQKNFISRFFN